MNGKVVKLLSAATVLPILTVSTALASPASSEAPWQSAVRSSERAPNQQIHVALTFYATLHTKPKAQSISTSIRLTENSQIRGKKYVQDSTLLEKIPGSNSVTKLYDGLGLEYVNDGTGWKKSGPSNPLTGASETLKIAEKWKTSESRTAIKNGYGYKFQVGLQQLDPMMSAGVTSISNSPAWTQALTHAKIIVAADTRASGGSQRVTLETLNVRLHLTSSQVTKIFGDVGSGSSQTVTKTVYGGSGASSGPTADVIVTEVIRFGYAEQPVPTPAHLPK